MNFREYLRYFLLMAFMPRSLKTMEWRMLRLLNKDRKRHGLAPVRMQEDLRDVARKHSADMARQDYFDHVNLKAESPGDRLRGARVSDVVSGENLAKVGGYANPTQFAERGLMDSPGHRANILNASYNVVGIGVVKNQRKVYFLRKISQSGFLFLTANCRRVLRYGKVCGCMEQYSGRSTEFCAMLKSPK